MARETFGVSGSSPASTTQARAEVYERLGIPTVATVRWTADRMLRHLVPEGTSRSGATRPARSSIVEVPLHQDWIGRPLRALEEATGARVAYLMRFGIGTLPTAVHRAAGRRPGVHAGHRRHRRRRARASPRRAARGRALTMRVAIAGAGNVGRSIAQELIEQRPPGDADRAAAAPCCAPSGCRQAEWVLADACELASLEEADLAGCDVVVAATGDDKVNLVVSLLAKTEFAVPRVVARVNRAENEWLFTEQWGVDVAVSKPRLMAALVEEAVTVGDLVRLMTFRQGEANLVEITLPQDAPYVGRAGARRAAAARHRAGRDPARQAGAGADPGRPAGGRRRADLRLHGRGRGRRSARSCSAPTASSAPAGS